MEYDVVRSKRKTISVQVGREGKVIVRAPEHLGTREIERFVARHRAWIEARTAQRAPRLQLGDGGSVELAGVRYVVESGPKAELCDGRLILPREGREEAFTALLKRTARVRMKALLDDVCARGGFSYAKLNITSARRRWGSCSASGHISFSFRSVFLPDPLAEYLAVHELCHTRHMDHSPRFWREVAALVPDYRERRAALKSYLWATDCL